MAYTDEIEVISSAFDDLQSQNTRLLQQMAKRDDLSNQLVSERIKIGNAAAQHKQEQASAAAAVQRAERLAAVLQERVNELQSKLQVESQQNTRLCSLTSPCILSIHAVQRQNKRCTIPGAWDGILFSVWYCCPDHMDFLLPRRA